MAGSQHWVRFTHEGKDGFGLLQGESIQVHEGDMFAQAKANGSVLPLAAVTLRAPCKPGKVIALWNNFNALAAKLGVSLPEDPLWLLKADTTVNDPGATIKRPPAYEGRIAYEGELGIVIGKRCSMADEAEAAAAIFGYTVVNDVTGGDVLRKDPNFPQWARSKSYDGFCPFGPSIATGVDVSGLSVKLVLDGAERQNYPLSDMVFQPVKLVSLLSRDMTLMPGDLICCGTSVGVGSIKGPVSRVDVTIDGIGTLTNHFEL
ncbi:MAG: fumarylacetoacetate hydrolase family protein [Rhodospirillales bacterium]|nr:fumarylacetoacetate hydrolase family protein [Rhodospirillales bacterium]MDE2319068.1 fumarylacetoacetate hydrolase family protein [Rhodospirillales bacterium]